MSQPHQNHPILNLLGRIIGFMQSHNSKVRILDFVVALGFIAWGIYRAEYMWSIVGAVLFVVALLNPYVWVMKMLNKPPKNDTPPNSLT